MDVEVSDYGASVPMPPAPLPPMIPVVVEMTRMPLMPGDVLALRYDGPLLREQFNALRGYAQRNVPEGVHVLVLDQKMTLQVVDPSLRPVEVGSEEGSW